MTTMLLKLPVEFTSPVTEKPAQPQEIPDVNTLKHKVLKLLVAGVKPSIIESSVGCSLSYISQLASDPVFLDQILEAKVKRAKEETSTRETYENLEKDILKKLSNAIHNTHKPMELARVLQVVQAKKFNLTDDPQNNGQPQPTQVIKLTLNKRVSNNFIINSNRDIIGIGDQSFAAMPTTALLEAAKEVPKILEHKNESLAATDQNSAEPLEM